MGKLFLFTGAGISADSGISTFRGATGLWEGENVNKVCNYNNWQDNYQEVHDFYNARRTGLAAVNPNAAHHMAKSWQDRYEMVSITQNIDDLFERAGCTDVIHVHGKLTAMRCIACGNGWDIGYSEWVIGDECPKEHCHCKGAIKPNVIFFNELAPEYRKLHKAVDSLTADDVAVVIGTSFQVIDIAGMLQHKKCFKVLNNLTPGGVVVEGKTIEEYFFDEVRYGKAVDVIEEVDGLVRSRIG